MQHVPTIFRASEGCAQVPREQRHAQWAAEATPELRERLSHSALAGHRVLCRQDRWECLLGFLISQNNNIKRISQIVQRLRALGEPIGVPDAEEHGEEYVWPAPAVLAAQSETALRDLGLGSCARRGGSTHGGRSCGTPVRESVEC